MKLIKRKKEIYPISSNFDRYLREFNRSIRMSLDYEDLLNYDNAISLYDKSGRDTLWSTLMYSPQSIQEINEGLLRIYSFLRTEGDLSLLKHLKVDRIDLCLYGNTKPFRIRIINTLNENFDYFYVKKADCSRLFGLELEHILSPNRISFLYYKDTLIEDHISGIPADLFLENKVFFRHINKIRLAKEFVKFNERCFLQLLGDMHSSNFVVDITMDFEDNYYRLRAIDFDQQSYEPQKKVYYPQFFSQNYKYVKIVMDELNDTSISQYQKEERALLHKRIVSSTYRINKLFESLKDFPLAPKENIEILKDQLSEHYKQGCFKDANTMPELVRCSLSMIKM